ncbi:hypothetical protein BGZ73_000269 [Actinomortierella ambigua]|nr:hypothetical protein BGZ73_000269 [Actinomortierella ambigua]
MHILFLTGILALISTVSADVTYNVIGFPDVETNSFAVEVNQKVYPLKTSKDDFPLWSAKIASASASDTYRYVQINEEKKVIKREAFDRHLAKKNAHATPNEFFERQHTFIDLPPLKQVYENVQPEPSEVFDFRQIATIHLTVDPDQFSDMMQHPRDVDHEPVRANFKFINAHTVYTANQVKFRVSGNGGRKYNKVSLGIKFDKDMGDTFFDHPHLKLRSEYIDPTMVREKLYMDILNSIGVPTYEGCYVRVYVNGDNTADYDPVAYNNKILGDNPEDNPMQQLIAFMKELVDWDPDEPNAMQYWTKRFDVKTYLRTAALEYLTGAWDNSWWRGNNYFMYYNPEQSRWQLIPTDFDHTFSTYNYIDVDTTYKKFGQTHLKEIDHPLVTKLILKNKEINKEFEKTLYTITKDVFNNKALDGRIDAYINLIKDDVAWDLAIDRSIYPGRVFEWTIKKFYDSLTKKVKHSPEGLKPWITSRVKIVPKQLGRHEIDNGDGETGLGSVDKK